MRQAQRKSPRCYETSIRAATRESACHATPETLTYMFTANIILKLLKIKFPLTYNAGIVSDNIGSGDNGYWGT